MKLDVLGLEAFVAVADHGGFGRAAEGLHITQTGLTRRVQNLEAVLGLRLLERTTRSTTLTASGREFLPRARRLLADLQGAFTEMREGGRAMRGDVTIACVPTVGVQYLARIMKRYAARHPENRIRVLDHSSVDVAAAVLRREAEFGITLAGTHHPELAATPLLKDRFVMVCRSDHALARRKSLAWRDLEGHPLVFVGRVSGNRELLDVALGDGELRLQLRYEVQRSSTAVGLAAEGLGAAIVPALAWQKVAYPSLRMIPLRRPVVTRSLTLIVRRNASLSPAAQALYDLVRAAPATP
jgi:DNA-binding transcriptional LysR family regulator